MRVLFTTPVLEHPPAGGPQLRIENSIKALGRVSELHVVSRVSRQNLGGPDAERFYAGLCRSFDYAPSCRWVSGNRYLRKARVLLGQWSGFDTRADVRALLNVVDRIGIDVVWFGYGNISFPLIRAMRLASPWLRLVCDTDSVWSRFILRELPHADGAVRKALIERSGRRKEAEERTFAETCDITTAVSDVDAEYYRSIAPFPDRIRRFSNVIDLSSYRDTPPPAPGLRRPCLFLGGSFGHYHSPMDTAARWVLQEVLPRVQALIPDVHLYVVGRGSERTLGRFVRQSVTITGKVATVLPYLCHATAALVPLKYESGTRFKILEAAACGVPIVSTTLGAEGLPVVHGQHVLIADTPEAFADAIVDLFRNQILARRLSTACRALVERNFSVETLEGEALEILRAIAPC